MLYVRKVPEGKTQSCSCRWWCVTLLTTFSISANRGQGRVVHARVMERRLKVHRSVRARIEAHPEGTKDEYRPQIRCWIDSEKTTRRLTRKEWLAEPPVHFDWVD